MGNVLVCVAALSALGCKRQAAVALTNASMDEVVEHQAAAVRMRPGEWEVAVTMPGVQGGAAVGPRSAARTSRLCLTARQVGRPTEMLGGGLMQAFKDDCRYDRFEMKDGRIDTAMHCVMPGGQRIAAASHGTFTATALAVESASEVGGPAGGPASSTRIRMVGRRVGACPTGRG